MALDLAPGRERVWVDTDLDGDLADEQHVSWEREGLRWWPGRRSSRPSHAPSRLTPRQQFHPNPLT